jgi:uncharacterized membrane protein YheB (UPF0754 family)
MLQQLVTSALLGAFIGWITNVMTIRLIFRPRRPVRIGPLLLQGVIPRRRREIAESLAATITRELVSARELWAAVDTAANRQRVLGGVRQALTERLDRLPQFPFRALVLSRVEDAVIRELGLYIDQLSHDPEWPERMLAHVPLEALIVQRLDAFDLADFERLIISVSHRELRQIEVLGGVLGFVVGLFLPLIQALVRW